jgi:hypothetical protein
MKSDVLDKKFSSAFIMNMALIKLDPQIGAIHLVPIIDLASTNHFTALPGVMRYIFSGQDARTTRVS